ncbi:flagellar filament capping protein FliD [Desulfosporosinus nitroreducens]|uniref:Flagellar hook-associated protein 2 n=1 Tax=Desulfosporosinus nitroreducens TaxID=2018668 RepID=A0ABT8QPH6_9FIRM|nr:flagellar filament capping protein FliD [Desulfosporosinus nitroreducens]MDO0821821.1 flagellar filament capping protein FliD [Desulfosporosinus nitroreducens]
MAVGSVGGVYGLSGSGMDIDSIVKKLMMGQQAKSDALFQKKTIAEWQKTAYNTVYDDISKFRDTMFNYKLQGTLSPNRVSSSNTSVATVTANADAANINHSLVVAQLASGVNMTSTDTISSTAGANKSTLATHMGVTDSFSLNIGNGSSSKSITIKPTDSIYEVVSAINNAGVNVKASYDSTLDRFFLSTTNMGSAAGISITTTTMSTDASGTDVGADFIKGLKIFPTGLPSGNDGGTAPVPTTGPDGNGNYTHSTVFSSPKGKNAEFKLDGAYLSQSNNTFTISGVTYSLTGVSPDVTGTTIADKLASGTAINVSVTKDTDGAVASIQALVDSYNKIMESLNGMVNETRYKDYSPLTDAQKAELKDSEITAWEAKAKSGMLHNDSTLMSLINNIRNSMSSAVSGINSTYNPASGGSITYNSASSIGITTSSNYREGGKLYLNTDKLRTALNANPDVLNQLFGNSGTTKADGTIDIKTQGIAGRLYDSIKTTMTELNTIAGTTSSAKYDTSSNYAKKISDYTKMMGVAADRFDVMQTAYYRQFNAMEVALQQLSAQSSWLSSVGSSS